MKHNAQHHRERQRKVQAEYRARLQAKLEQVELIRAELQAAEEEVKRLRSKLGRTRTVEEDRMRFEPRIAELLENENSESTIIRMMNNENGMNRGRGYWRQFIDPLRRKLKDRG